MKRKICPWSVLLSCLVALTFTGSAFGALHYEAESSVATDGQPPLATRIEAWVDGERSRIDIVESSNPLLPAGSYLVTQDGGQTVLRVDPKAETYAVFDVDGLLKVAGTMLGGLQGMLRLQISDPVVEKLVDEESEDLFGLATRHVQYRTTYELQIKALGMKRRQQVERLQDLWMTSDIEDPAMTVWLRSRSQATGNEDLDRLIAAELDKVEGLTLKSTETSTSTDKKGRQSVTRSTLEVTSFERGAELGDDRVRVPAEYREVEPITTPGQQEGGGNPFKGVFGRGR
ncbi:MAG: hypothetical protein AAF604_12130 [Acidobacteriota bacterium]